MGANPDQLALNKNRIEMSATLIEIRPHQNGWKGFRSTRRRAAFLEERSGNQLRAEPRELSLRRDSDSRLNWQRRVDDPFHRSGRKM